MNPDRPNRIRQPTRPDNSAPRGRAPIDSKPFKIKVRYPKPKDDPRAQRRPKESRGVQAADQLRDLSDKAQARLEEKVGSSPIIQMAAAASIGSGAFIDGASKMARDGEQLAHFPVLGCTMMALGLAKMAATTLPVERAWQLVRHRMAQTTATLGLMATEMADVIQGSGTIYHPYYYSLLGLLASTKVVLDAHGLRQLGNRFRAAAKESAEALDRLVHEEARRHRKEKE